MDGRASLRVTTLAAALGLTIAGGAAVQAQSPKEGGGAAPIVLDLVRGDSWHDWTPDLFSSTVAELSGGSLVVRDIGEISERDVPGMVVSGEADLGWAFARGLESVDAKGFEALLAPFVVNDAATLKAIATGPIGADMLADLADQGLVGLSIDPGSRRWLVGRDHPFVRLADFEGARFSVPMLASNTALMQALGAESVVSFDVSDEALDASGADGVLTSINNVYDGRVLTTNLAIHAVPLVWFANADTFSSLSAEHQDVLRSAAKVVQESKLEATNDAESTLSVCAAGAKLVRASDEDVAEIVAAVQPVIDAMADDPVIARYLDRIAELKAGVAPAPYPASCDTIVETDRLAGIPDGTYTATVSRTDALRTGWPDPCALAGEVGTVTLVFQGETWSQLGACGDGPSEVGSGGKLEYDGDTLVIREPGLPGQATFAWAADGDSLTLEVVETDADYAPLAVLEYLFEHEFRRTPA